MMNWFKLIVNGLRRFFHLNPPSLSTSAEAKPGTDTVPSGTTSPIIPMWTPSSILDPPTPVIPVADPTPWLTWMKSHLGESEKTGEQATAFEKMIFSYTNYGDLNGVEVAGCAATACAALEVTGFKSPHSAAAISFKDYGTSCDLKPGCILVFTWDSGEHHVTFLDHIVDDKYVCALGGNQHHKLDVSVYPRRNISYVRWPVNA